MSDILSKTSSKELTKKTITETSEPVVQVNPAMAVEGAVMNAQNKGLDTVELPRAVVEAFWHGTFVGDYFSYKGVTVFVEGTQEAVKKERALTMEEKLHGSSKVS